MLFLQGLSNSGSLKTDNKGINRLLLQIQNFLLFVLKIIQIYAKESEKQKFVIHQTIKCFLLFGLTLNAFADNSEETVKTNDINRTGGFNRLDTKASSVPLQNGHPHASMELASRGEDSDIKISFRRSRKELSKELLNTVHDVIKVLFFKTTNSNEILKKQAKIFWFELEEKISSYDWDMPQVLDLLRKRISVKKKNKYKKQVIILVMGELLKRSSLSDKVLFLDIVVLLRGV